MCTIPPAQPCATCRPRSLVRLDRVALGREATLHERHDAAHDGLVEGAEEVRIEPSEGGVEIGPPV